MIGNDVVDLTAAASESNWRRKGFLNKVFLAKEQDLIFSAGDANQMVWLLWSMKEAAYKAHQREFSLPRRLNWKDFNCLSNNFAEANASGMVRIGKSSYYTSSEISHDHIHTSARKENISAVKNDIFETPSEGMKQQLLEHISEELKLLRQHLAIHKNKHGVPYITHQNLLLTNLISFSDHGRFSAFTLSLMNCEIPVKHY